LPHLHARQAAALATAKETAHQPQVVSATQAAQFV